MKRILFMAERAVLKGQTGGAFGAYGWSGEAPGRIFDTMHHVLKMNMVSGPLGIKSPFESHAYEKARTYGHMIAKNIDR